MSPDPNPRMNVEALVSKPLGSRAIVSGRQMRQARVADLLETVGLPPDNIDRMLH